MSAEVLSEAAAFGAAANASNMQVLVAGGAMPENYLAANKVFSESRVDDAAQVWSAVVNQLVRAGLSLSLVELSNEPNGHWNTYIEPAVWARLACAAQAALVARGMGTVGISGPGTSLGTSESYFAALKQQGALKCVATLSVHSWEDTATTAGPHEMSAMLRQYALLRSKYDPGHRKGWAATEYGSRAAQINGHTFNHTVKDCYPTLYTNDSLPADAESMSPLYGARVAAFTLLHMNSGFDTAHYWWVSDYGWSPLCFGLVTRGSTHTAAYTAIRTLLADAPFSVQGLWMVERQWEDTDTVQSAAVTADGRAVVLWIAHLPNQDKAGTPRPLHRTYQLVHGDGVTGALTLDAVQGTSLPSRLVSGERMHCCASGSGACGREVGPGSPPRTWRAEQ
jgi:hypothetical protein